MSLSAHQLSVRMNGIGASEIATIAGLNPMQSPIEVYEKKLGLVTDDGNSEQADWGHAMEPVIAGWYAKTCGAELVECPTLVHPDLNWIIATPDRMWADLSRGVEIKNVGEHMSFHWRSGPGGEPDYVRAQAMWGMIVTGLKCWDIVACIGGLPPVIYPVEYDREFAGMLIEIGDSFWHDCVLKQIPPAVDASDAYKGFLARRFPRGNGMRKDDSVGVLAREYELLGKQEKAAKSSRDLLANQIRDAIGEHNGLIGDWGKVTWKADKNGKRVLRVKLEKP